MAIIISENSVLSRKQAQAVREHIEWLNENFGQYEYVFIKTAALIGGGKTVGIFCQFILDVTLALKATKAYKNANKNYIFTDRYGPGGQHEEIIQVMGLIDALKEMYNKIGTSSARKLARTR